MYELTLILNFDCDFDLRRHKLTQKTKDKNKLITCFVRFYDIILQIDNA